MSRKNRNNKMQKLCLNCDNCLSNDFCCIKNDYIDTMCGDYCDEFCQSPQSETYNCGFSIERPLYCFVKDIITINDFMFNDKKVTFNVPYYIEYDFYDNNYIAFDEYLNIFMVQPTVELLKIHFTAQVRDKMLYEKSKTYQKIAKIAKIEVIDEKD